jgi:hypothetical protein
MQHSSFVLLSAAAVAAAAVAALHNVVAVDTLLSSLVRAIGPIRRSVRTYIVVIHSLAVVRWLRLDPRTTMVFNYIPLICGVVVYWATDWWHWFGLKFISPLNQHSGIRT